MRSCRHLSCRSPSLRRLVRLRRNSPVNHGPCRAPRATAQRMPAQQASVRQHMTARWRLLLHSGPRNRPRRQCFRRQSQPWRQILRLRRVIARQLQVVGKSVRLTGKRQKEGHLRNQVAPALQMGGRMQHRWAPCSFQKPPIAPSPDCVLV